MNIFILDKDPKLAAIYHCNKHVVKMILEYSHLLSNAHYLVDGTYLFKPSWLNHPCTKWTLESKGNYDYLYQLRESLVSEYTYRYTKIHKLNKIDPKYKNYPGKNSDSNLTFLSCMPKDCIISEDPITNYRHYFNTKKRHLSKWSKRPHPSWYK